MYNKKITYKKNTNTIAKLAKTVKTLAVRDKPEMKYFTTDANNTTLNSFGRTDNVSNIAQGTGSGQRVGLKIRIYSIKINIATVFPLNTAGSAKYYLVQDTQQVYQDLPEYPDLMQVGASPLLDFRNIANMSRFKVLKTLFVTATADNRSGAIYRTINWSSKNGLVQEYSLDAISRLIKNGIYLISVSDSLLQGPVKAHTYQTTYTDV